MTVSNWFEALDPLEDSVELWNTFKHETLETARGCDVGASEVKGWFRVGGDAGQHKKRVALLGWLGAGTSTGLCFVGLELF